MSDTPSSGPPPLAAKPNAPPSRAGLKRTFSVGAGPKKCAVVSNAKFNGAPIGSNTLRPGAKKAGLGAGGIGGNSTGVGFSACSTTNGANSSGPASYSNSTSSTVTYASLGPAPSTVAGNNEAPIRGVRSLNRAPSGSFTTSGVHSPAGRPLAGAATSSVSNGGASGGAPKRTAPGKLSSAAYATFSGGSSSPGDTTATSPRVSPRYSVGDPSSDSEKTATSSTSLARRPTAPPRPTTLRNSATRANLQYTSTSEPSSPPGSDGGSANGSVPPSPVKTGAQLRPPVPKKNISQAVLHSDAAITSSAPTSSPASSIHATENRSASPHLIPLRSSAHTQKPAQPNALARSDEVHSDSGASNADRPAATPVLRPTTTCANLVHHKSVSSSPNGTLVPYVFVSILFPRPSLTL